jgi:CrcB protein
VLEVFKQCLVVGLGGFLGSIARFAVGTWIVNRYAGTFPWATFIINISGSFLLGLIGTLLLNRILINPNWRLFVTIGFIGAYTTFSTFEYESARLGNSWQALGNLLGSVVAGYGAVWIGIKLAESWVRRI